MLGQPEFDRDSYRVVFGDFAFWRPYFEEVCRRHALPAERLQAFSGDRSNPVAMVGDLFLKIAIRYAEPPPVSGLEADALEDLQEQGFPAPALVARGELFPENAHWPWPYMITRRFAGEPLGEFRKGSSREEQIRLVRELGEVIGRLHRCQPRRTRFPLERTVAYQQRRFGDGDLAGNPRRELALSWRPDASRPAAFLHGDLEDDHIFQLGGHITGLVDFGDVKIGDPVYDFVTLWHFLFERDEESFGEFLEAYGREPLSPHEWRLLDVYTVLHEWGPFDVS